MICPRCGSDNIKQRWNWVRTKDMVTHGVEYKQFLSRNVGYFCEDCWFKFVNVSKSYSETACVK